MLSHLLMLFWFLVCTTGRHRAFQMIQYRRPCAFGNDSFIVCRSLSVDVEQGIQLYQTGGLDPQIVLKGERLSYFLLGCGLLLVKVLQLIFDRFQTLGHLRQCVVDTGKISARVCTQGRPMGHLSFHNQELMEHCQKLKEYAQFVDEVRKRLDEGARLEDAADGAVNSCIE